MSEVSPFTSSWWGWWDVEMSKGDLRSLIVATNRKARSTPGSCSATSTGEARTASNVLSPVTLQTAASMRMKNGSEASKTTSSRSAPAKLYGELTEPAARTRQS